MRTRILLAYNGALTEYCGKADRGISFGVFSNLRHSHTKYDLITALGAALDKTITARMPDEEALVVVLKHLLLPNVTSNIHSFNSYFIRKLTIRVGDYNVKWDDKTQLKRLLDATNIIIGINKATDENPRVVIHDSRPVIIEEYAGVQMKRPAPGR